MKNSFLSIKGIIHNNHSELETEQIDLNIENGLKIIRELIGKDGYEEDLKRNLPKVILYRIEVPKNTDLNRYFEIMNTRGEQLEQHDILKAHLMNNLSGNSDKAVFAKIWEACSDMTGYVQMHFAKEDRETIFDSSWDVIPSENWEDYCKIDRKDSDDEKEKTIEEIINDPSNASVSDNGNKEDGNRVRFNSIIEFPFFLLHTLKVLITIKDIHHQNASKEIIADQLDDKRLDDTFTYVIKNGITGAGAVLDEKEPKAQFSRDFIICLLRTRYLFDQYIIKREYANVESDGEWSLKRLKCNNKSATYLNSCSLNSSENDEEEKKDNQTETNKMIQSALRVSYTSPKAMHWITQLLLWLSEDNYRHTAQNSEDLTDYSAVAESVAQKAVKQDFLDKYQEDSYEKEVNIPHIVFNYLDYLLWKENRNKYDKFMFEFRNSVEHWYPQNPSEGTFESWGKGVNRFGNLCVIQREVNSKFSNMSPEAKKSTFTKMIDKGSLKLRIMRDLTKEQENMTASLYWKEVACKKHEDEMIALLRDACRSVCDDNSNTEQE